MAKKKKAEPKPFKVLRIPGKYKGKIPLSVIRAAVIKVRDERLAREAALAESS